MKDKKTRALACEVLGTSAVVLSVCGLIAVLLEAGKVWPVAYVGTPWCAALAYFAGRAETTEAWKSGRWTDMSKQCVRGQIAAAVSTCFPWWPCSWSRGFRAWTSGTA